MRKTIATENVTVAEAKATATTATSYLLESINGLAREVQRIAVDLRKVTNPWSPKAADLTEAEISNTVMDCELRFSNLMTDLVEKAGYKVEDEIDEMFLSIFVNAVAGIGSDFSAAKKVAFQKLIDENPDWETWGDEDVDEDEDDWEDDADEVIVVA